MWAHPHGCGEHTLVGERPMADTGSSPRVWGTQSVVLPDCLGTGLIPTGVGNTIMSGSAGRLMGAHPHGCGEHHVESHHVRVRRGSSPRVWGTRPPLRPTRPSARLIPTGVGNTNPLTVHDNPCRAHPHGCGEHGHVRCKRGVNEGSSPRVWGTRHGHTDRSRGKRLIPTGVGNTKANVIGSCRCWAHPHGCGEHG